MASEAHMDTVESAIESIRNGELVIVVDDPSRENEGDLVVAASKVTPEHINTMIRDARGIVCVPMQAARLRQLGLGAMVPENREAHSTAFTVSVDAAEGITTGVSAHDRARTISLLADLNVGPEAFVQPGHLFPLQARSGGVLERAGHTEAAVDLASLAGLAPAGVICEILNEDGTSARLPELIEFKKKKGLKIISVAQLIEYRYQRETLVRKIEERLVETMVGFFDLHIYESILDKRRHFAFTKGALTEEPTLVRVHSESLLKDVFSGGDVPEVAGALRKIYEAGTGAFVYITQPHGGFNFSKPEGGEQLPLRQVGIGSQILAQLGLKKLRLLTSRPDRQVVGVDGFGVEVVEALPLK